MRGHKFQLVRVFGKAWLQESEQAREGSISDGKDTVYTMATMPGDSCLGYCV